MKNNQLITLVSRFVVISNSRCINPTDTSISTVTISECNSSGSQTITILVTRVSACG